MSDFFDGLEHDLDYGKSESALAPRPLFTNPCIRCGGSGNFYGFSGRLVGPCHTCKGTGKQTYARPPEVRAKARAQSAARKANAAEAWIQANPEDHAWIVSRGPRFAFAAEMGAALAKYGRLTDGQHAAVTRLRLKDAARDAERAEERAKVEAAAPVVTMDKIEAAFALASQRKANPILRLDTFKFSTAQADSRNPGAIYVKEAGTYLGKIAGGKFVRKFGSCDDVTESRILAAAASPEEAAIAYGRQFSKCSICGQTLTDPTSIERGIGPICAGKFGW